MRTRWFSDLNEYKNNYMFCWIGFGLVFSVLFSGIVFLHFTVPNFDRQISHWLSSQMTFSSIFIFGIISDFGDLNLIVPLTFGLFVFFLWKREWINAFGLIFCVFIGGIVSSLLKYFFQQPKMNFVQSNVFEIDFGFPSGHTIMAILFYGYLAYLLVNRTQNKKLQWIIMVCAGLISLLVGLSRLLIGVHIPTDVLSGWVFGLTWLIISIGISQKILTKTIHYPFREND